MKQKVKLSKYSIIVTAITLLTLIGVMIYLMYIGQEVAGMVIAGVIILCSGGAAFYMPESVHVTETDLIIAFQLRRKIIPLSSIESAELFSPSLTKTVRICGSGGFYGYWGWFYNRSVGRFFVYSTTLSEGVLIRLTSGRRCLIGSPNPSALLSALTHSPHN